MTQMKQKCVVKDYSVVWLQNWYLFYIIGIVLTTLSTDSVYVALVVNSSTYLSLKGANKRHRNGFNVQPMPNFLFGLTGSHLNIKHQ